ncbi:MAG: hypothetical protein FWH12_02220 [Treponema sp.]|nr:hypothetical protein [Treponema sp.]
MKQRTYTVTVTGLRHNTFRITAKSAGKAKAEAERRFREEYGEYFDSITSSAVADWLRRVEEDNGN